MKARKQVFARLTVAVSVGVMLAGLAGCGGDEKGKVSGPTSTVPATAPPNTAAQQQGGSGMPTTR